MGTRRGRTAAFWLLCIGAIGTAVADDAPVAVEHIEQATLLKYLADNDTLTLIDARSADEYATGHILGARNVPHDQVAAHAAELPADLAAPIVVYCKTGKRATLLASALTERGYSNVRVLGPAQLFWSDTAPMFNCGVEASAEPEILSRKQP
jgi:rhodanese-related sulfurtransferase